MSDSDEQVEFSPKKSRESNNSDGSPSRRSDSKSSNGDGKVVLQLKNVPDATEVELREFLNSPSSLRKCILYDNSWFLVFGDDVSSRAALESVRGRVLRDSKLYPKLLSLKHLPKRLAKPAPPEGCGIWNRAPGNTLPQSVYEQHGCTGERVPVQVEVPEWSAIISERGKWRNAQKACGMLPVTRTTGPDPSRGWGMGRGRPLSDSNEV
eukprot:NODE_6789_length_842_cov_50.172462_g6191_i0.p1 GENE.NODE_6789_length_842_cov_50.172462_g6191_i0~~NODE_6789_length_842_cov_50.172462_g6191_i0.p1  ORF type:complete len:209 (-),score=36.78 NODE_6789_length_842_cov_50.172462_g6191_i0:106-732(-)